LAVFVLANFSLNSAAVQSNIDHTLAVNYSDPPGDKPKEWFACQSSRQCVLVPVSCGASFAVNEDFKDKADPFSKLPEPNPLRDVCARPSQNSAVGALCKNDLCVTLLAPTK